MKFLVLLVVVLALLWLARGGLRRLGNREPPKPPPPLANDEMVACRHCGVHLPRGDAVPGRDGLYCSEAHRAAGEPADR